MKQVLSWFCLCAHCVFASQLHVYDEKTHALLRQTANQKEIAACLNTIGVRFEQWEASQMLGPASSEEEIQEAYKADIERWKWENGFQSVDVLRVSSDQPNKVQLRQKFLREHTHDEPEIRFFVEGSGLFFLHVEGAVYSVLCEKGDLISIPEQYRHWFDMGADPFFTAIRFFTRTDGWIPYFTGDLIAETFIQDKQVGRMKSICVKVALQEGTEDAVRTWFQTLMDRQKETLESLRQEGVVVESAFLDETLKGSFLVYYMRAQDVEKAIEVFQSSSLAIDAYHKECWGKYCKEAKPLEQLLDLDTIAPLQAAIIETK